MSRADRDSLLGLAASLVAAVVAVTCHRGARLDVPSAQAGTEKKAVPSARTAPRPSAAPAPLASSLPRVLVQEASGLGRFYAALAGLEAKKRTDSVRIVWFGDSHTAADYLTGAVRRRLEMRFGSGGPGFVRVGASPYRHDGVRVLRDGKWKLSPEPPARRTLEGDGIFGLGGLLALPTSKEARVEIRVDPKRIHGTIRYDLVYQAKPGASFRLTIGKKQETIDPRTPAERVSESGIVALHREGAPGETFEIGMPTGEVRFAGLIAESSEPGVVLDTIGIDGARVGTVLAWNADAFAKEIATRRPELAVVAFGTNEAFDTRSPDAIIGEIGEVVARVRRGAPNADCLVVGPPDAAQPDLSSLPRVQEMDAAERRAASQSGCAYFSLFESMGGAGGFVAWMRETPPLARADRIHLTLPGYERLGDALAQTLIEGYEEKKP
ncbi:MAG TPA: GDSL-type esterase/lipase family protein [Polyangiaceae bacterium]